MKKFIVSYILVISSIVCSGQTKKFYADSLIVKSKYDSVNRIKIKDFTNIKFKRIELVQLQEFLVKKQKQVVDKNGKTTEEYEKAYKVVRPALMRREDSVNMSNIGQRKTLKRTDYNLLFSILYANYNRMEEIMCYDPGHGILFYDEHGKMCGFIEICFLCEHMYSTRNVPLYSLLDPEGYKKLWNLFAKYFKYKIK